MVKVVFGSDWLTSVANMTRTSVVRFLRTVDCLRYRKSNILRNTTRSPSDQYHANQVSPSFNSSDRSLSASGAANFDTIDLSWMFDLGFFLSQVAL